MPFYSYPNPLKHSAHHYTVYRLNGDNEESTKRYTENMEHAVSHQLCPEVQHEGIEHHCTATLTLNSIPEEGISSV